MKPQIWWKPGLKGGLLSRQWAQAFVFPLPNLKRSELEVSLRFKAQALLPSPDIPLSSRFVRHQGKLFGVVTVDRLPEPKPEGELVLGMPLTLPRTWPADCVLVVASPEGWELHLYEARILSSSYPPVQPDTAVAKKILSRHEGKPVYWVAPDPANEPAPPSWAAPAPPWPSSQPWGIPWQTPKEPVWQWVLGSLLLLVGLAALLLAGWSTLSFKTERNTRWEAWLESARTRAGAPALSAQKITELKARAGEPLEDVLASLAASWTEVEIRRFELSDGKVSLTARASSALSAVTALSKQPLAKNFRVLQIRPVPGGEEFDLEGSVSR